MKWQSGDKVTVEGDDLTVWTVSEGPCTEGPQYVLLVRPGYALVAHQDSLAWAEPLRY